MIWSTASITAWVGLDRPHRRVFAQYDDRTQIDLVVCEASSGRLPGAVVLYDPQGRVDTAPAVAVEVSPAQVREWACLAWVALANLGKYLRRASPWEALDRLGEACVTSGNCGLSRRVSVILSME